MQGLGILSRFLLGFWGFGASALLTLQGEFGCASNCREGWLQLHFRFNHQRFSSSLYVHFLQLVANAGLGILVHFFAGFLRVLGHLHYLPCKVNSDLLQIGEGWLQLHFRFNHQTFSSSLYVHFKFIFELQCMFILSSNEHKVNLNCSKMNWKWTQNEQFRGEKKTSKYWKKYPEKIPAHKNSGTHLCSKMGISVSILRDNFWIATILCPRHFLSLIGPLGKALGLITVLFSAKAPRELTLKSQRQGTPGGTFKHIF